MHPTCWLELVWFSVRSSSDVVPSLPPMQTPLSQWVISVISWRRWSQKRERPCWRRFLFQIPSLMQFSPLGNTPLPRRWRLQLLIFMSTVIHILRGSDLLGHCTVITRWLQLRKWDHISLLEVSLAVELVYTYHVLLLCVLSLVTSEQLYAFTCTISLAMYNCGCDYMCLQ